MKRKVALYVHDILQNMQDAEEFIQGLSYDQFAKDKKTFNAVVRAIEVIGEATKNVPASVRNKYTAVPWKRDKVIHLYFGVDREAVWLVVKERIPVIKPIIEQVFRDLEEQEK
jgi:uncharacterized protein with HEPN domain